jgi:hypothetical protein
LIDSHDFGKVTEGVPEYTVLSGTYTPATTGMYALEIENTRTALSSTDLKNYIDTIMLEPVNPMLSCDGQTFSTWFNLTRNFELSAGPAEANKDYWMWVGFSGNYPGINISGVNVPLNYDVLVELNLMYPGFPGTGFVGQLDGDGNATATMTWKPNASLKGLTIWFAYVVLSPGGGLPILAASNPINATVTSFY